MSDHQNRPDGPEALKAQGVPQHAVEGLERANLDFGRVRRLIEKFGPIAVEILSELFDRWVLDEGTKVLNGKWNQTTGEWELVNIDGDAPEGQPR